MRQPQKNADKKRRQKTKMPKHHHSLSIRISRNDNPHILHNRAGCGDFFFICMNVKFTFMNVKSIFMNVKTPSSLSTFYPPYLKAS